MKPYKVTVDMMMRWTLKINADSQEEADKLAGGVDYEDMEAAGDMCEVRKIEIVDVEEVIDE